MKLFKWFFDDTSAEAEHDSSAEVETEEVEVEATEEEVDEYSIEEDFSEFDIKSPFLFNKALDEPEQEVDESSEEEAEEVSEETEETEKTEDNAPEVPVQTGPYRTLKYHGQEIPVQSEEEFMRLASQGLDYTKKTQQLAPYRNIIDQVNSDPVLAEKVMTLIQTGTLPELQKAQAATRTPEPDEPNDDETWDEFIERRDSWRKEQATQSQGQINPGDENALFMQKFNAALEARERQELATNVARHTISDPYHEDVIRSFQTELTPAILRAMNDDVTTYQIVYDQLRTMIKGEPFFAKQSKTPQGQAETQVAQKPKAPTQAVNMKTGSTKAPYVEHARGQKAPGTRKKGLLGLPDDIWAVSESDFNSFVDKQIQSR